MHVNGRRYGRKWLKNVGTTKWKDREKVEVR